MNSKGQTPKLVLRGGDISKVLLMLLKEASTEATAWVSKKIEILLGVPSKKELYLAFSLAPRFTGKEHVSGNFDTESFQFSRFSTDEISRVLLLRTFPFKDKNEYVNTIQELVQHADLNESVCLYKSLMLLPNPELLATLAVGGVRSSADSIFEAICLENPYPASYFSENAWNHMVLKAVFTEKPIARIIGLDERRNAALARMATDFAHERWAAGREVSPELWRLVAPFLERTNFSDLEHLVLKGTEQEKRAAFLCCSEASNSFAFLEKHAELMNYDRENLTWESLT